MNSKLKNALISLLPLSYLLNPSSSSAQENEYSYPLGFTIKSIGGVPGGIEINKGYTVHYAANGGNGGGRGFNVATVNTNTLDFESFKNFDPNIQSPDTLYHMSDHISGIENGKFVIITIGENAGINHTNSCQKLERPDIEQIVSTFKNLGSKQIDNYCFNGAYAASFFKGDTSSYEESLVNADTYNPSPYTRIVKIFQKTSKKPSLIIDTWIGTNYVNSDITATNLVLDRVVTLQHSSDMRNWTNVHSWWADREFRTISHPTTNLNSSFYRLDLDNTTVMISE